MRNGLARAAGIFKDVNPYAAAHAFLGTIRNSPWKMQVLCVDPLPECTDDEVLEAFVDIFLNRMRPQPGQGPSTATGWQTGAGLDAPDPGEIAQLPSATY